MESLKKLNKDKTKVIKTLIKGYQRAPGPGGIKGLKKFKNDGVESNDPTPKKLSPKFLEIPDLPKVHLIGGASRPVYQPEIPRFGEGSDLDVTETG